MSLRIAKGTLAAALVVCVPFGAYFEGVFPVGYADPVGIPTDCVGETGPGVRVGVQRFTRDECIARYPQRLQRVWASLDRCMDADVTMDQAAAMMSWADNVGVRAACASTLARLLNAGADNSVWCAQLPRWNKATKFGITIVLPGLVKRRAAERDMCLGHVSDTYVAQVSP